MDTELLKSVPLFATLSEDALRELATWINELSVSTGKHLVDEGDYSYELFIIRDGTAEVLRQGERVAELGPGDFFGEMGVLERAQRGATVVAKTPMSLFTLSHWDLERMRKSAPEMVEAIRAAIEERRPDS
jgi:CRP-like cAMP-binding protein